MDGGKWKNLVLFHFAIKNNFLLTGDKSVLKNIFLGFLGDISGPN